MSEKCAVTPESVLPDEANTTIASGVEVRKGTVAAFIANAKILGALSPADPDYAAIEAQLRGLAPAVRAIGLLDVFQPRTATIAALVGE